MKTLKFAALGLFAGFIFTGCCNCNKKSPSNFTFQETVWQLTHLDGKQIKTDNNFNIAFLSNGRITGKGACNTFFGPWEPVQGKTNGIKVSNVASTLMACLNGMDNEAEFFRMLEDVTEYRIEGGKLYLFQGNTQRAILQGTNKRVN